MCTYPIQGFYLCPLRSIAVTLKAPIPSYHVPHCSCAPSRSLGRNYPIYHHNSHLSVTVSSATRVYMPATRSSSGAFKHPPPARKASSRNALEPRSGPNQSSSSSLSLDLSPMPLRQQPSITSKKAKAKTPIPATQEVIEISSDEDDTPPPPRKVGPPGPNTSDLRREVRKLKDVGSPVRPF